MMARWTRRVGIYTLALVVVGIITAVIFWRQLNVMQGQLAELEIDQRPWVSLVEIPKITGFTKAYDDWLIISLSFHVRNSGRSPATHVWITVNDTTSSPNPIAEQRRACPDTGELNPPKPDNYINIAMFPSDTVTIPSDINLAGDHLKGIRSLNKWNHAIVDGFVGCIWYTSIDTDTRHQTGMIFNLIRTKAPVLGNFVDLDEDPILQSTDVIVRYSMFGNGLTY